MYWFPLFLVLIEVEKCVCIWLSVWGHLKRIHVGTLLCGRKIHVNIPTLCVCIAEVLILFVSRAQMQVPSSSTIPESAVCIGLWEAGVGFSGDGCRWLCL